ncbi:RagB/SusD family nutrient uptake outer membrane protein [Sphingobacterium hungaricum]
MKTFIYTNIERLILLLLIGCLILLLQSCNREDFLNQSPNSSLVIPSTFEHFQAMLDRDATMNGANSIGLTPFLGEIASDDYYISDDAYNNILSPENRNLYLWKENPYEGTVAYSWQYPYEALLIANTVLDGLESMDEEGKATDQYQFIQAQARFHKAHIYHELAQVFCDVYNPNGDNLQRGIPLKDGSDINDDPYIVTVAQTYQEIISLLNMALPHLTADDTYRTRPSIQGAYALLSRVYLSMSDYEKAKLYADSCLAINSELLDFNLISTTYAYPFYGWSNPVNSTEMIFYSAMMGSLSQNLPTSYTFVCSDTTLMRSYATNDLRRLIFFEPRKDGSYLFKGSYNFNSGMYFSGLCVDEILLNRSESLVRAGDVDGSLADLNKLLKMRWNKAVVYPPITELDAGKLLKLVLQERRKELIFRGLRWTDLRRLNLEGYAITLKRKINGQEYFLRPGDPQWTFPYPLGLPINY